LDKIEIVLPNDDGGGRYIYQPPPCQKWQVDRQQKSSQRKRESPWWS
jgi:hypothetical protein